MKGPLRIVHAVRSDAFAGVERYIASLASHQQQQGHTVTVIGGDAEAMRRAINNPSVPHAPAATVLETARAIDEHRKCDVVHVHMTAAEVAALLAIRSWTVPVVATRHFAKRRGTSGLSRIPAALASRRVSAQVAVSNYVASRIDGTSTVVHSGVPNMEVSRRSAQRTKTVLVAQRLEREKQSSFALETFARSGLASAGWRLDVAGQGSEREALATLASRLHITDHVRFLGHRSDLALILQEAGLLMATCESEGLGLTALEAMAAGLPVVAVGAGGHLETVGRASAPALYNPGDSRGASALLVTLANDPDQRDTYGAELQSVQRRFFTIQTQARGTEAVYRRVLTWSS